MRPRGVKRSNPPALPLRQPVTRAGGSGHRERQAGETSLGRTQDPGAPPATPAACHQDSRRLYPSRRAGSPWAGPVDGAAPESSRGDAFVRWPASQRSLVHRLQGPVSAERSTLLLSADGHRLLLPATCCCVKRWSRTAKNSRFRPLSACSRNAACHGPSAPITVFLSPHLMACFSSLSSRYGGCG